MVEVGVGHHSAFGVSRLILRRPSCILHLQGPYGIKFSGVGGESEAPLFCVDVAFTITPRGRQEEQHKMLGTTLQPGLAGGVLGGAVLRDAMGELRAAFEAANPGATPISTL